MAYMIWSIDGLTPSWVEPELKHDRQNKTLTLKCAAIYDETGADPVAEIDAFHAISSEKIHINELGNGGTNLQVTNGKIFTVTATNKAGTETKTWEQCALQAVNVNLDSFYDEDNPGSVVEYELVIQYALNVSGLVFIFTPDPPSGYHKYSNIEFYEWYYEDGGLWVKANADTSSGAYGTEIGWTKITLPSPVKSVTVRGSACILPASIYVTGSIEGSREWIYSHDDNANNPFQEQKFTFDPATAPTEIEIYTTGHHGDDPNHGAWLHWIRVECI